MRFLRILRAGRTGGNRRRGAGRLCGPTSHPGGRRASKITVNYSCGDGTAFIVTFDVAHTTALVDEPGCGANDALPALARPGDHFVAGPAQLVGEGEVIRWSRGGERGARLPPRAAVSDLALGDALVPLVPAQAGTQNVESAGTL